MHSMKAIRIGLMLLIAHATAYAQDPRPTIPEIIAKTGPGGGMVDASIPSGVAPSVDVILSKVDAVVRGVVGAPHSYLSDDQRDVFTDYPILNPVFIYQKSLSPSPIPGIGPVATVTLLGGTININGREYAARFAALPSLPSGQECLLLLTREGSRYRIAGLHYGAFAITNGRVVVLTAKEGFAGEYRNAPATQVIADIVSRLSALRR